MNELLDKASLLTGNAGISETSIQQLEQLANEHPYFSIIQVLLAKKYRIENHIKFLPQVQKAALYFNNPYWLHYQLLENIPDVTLSEQGVIAGEIKSAEKTEEGKEQLPGDAIKEPDEKVVFTPDEIAAASSLAKQTLTINEEGQNVKDELVEIPPDELHPEKEELLEEIQEQNIQVQYSNENTAVTEEPVITQTEEPLSERSDEEILPTEEEKQAANALSEKDLIANVVEDTLVQPVSIEPIQNIETSPVDLTVEDTTAAENSAGDIAPTEEEVEAVNALSEKDLIANVVEDTLVQPVSIDSLDDAFPLPAASPGEHKEHIASAPSTPGEPVIPIEPYHTVDYFASQGIKLSLDKNPQDKLGKQLRSFTDWLKQMKKLGPEDVVKSTVADTEVDSTIKDIADTSNTPKEIITEAMADVLIKQGKNEQAIEVYNKLSFLNPDKSTYFADQIQKLKGS